MMAYAARSLVFKAELLAAAAITLGTYEKWLQQIRGNPHLGTAKRTGKDDGGWDLSAS